MAERKKILGASIGNCIHVVGINKFLQIAEEKGYETLTLGSKISIKKLIDEIKKNNPDIVAISYRLTPKTAEKLFKDLKEQIKDNKFDDIEYIFGGTPTIAKIAENSGIFNMVFDGAETVEKIYSYLNKSSIEKKEKNSQDLLERINEKYPYPLIRHHFGLPSLNETIKGVKKLAESEIIDIISIGPDQNAQEFFFKQDEMDKNHDGAGGVPLRTKVDLEKIFKSSKCGNYPLLRCYSGTNNLIKWAELLKETINICFGAVPIFWYSQLDNRSDRPLLEAIKENQAAIKWYAIKNIAVEVNDSHQWALRGSGDIIEVAAAYIAAFNAKNLGVKNYIQQFMLNTPTGISPEMDLAKMLAKKQLIEELEDKDFKIITMVRTGLSSLHPDFDIAKGQMASSISTAMHLKPHIVHVVGYCEGDYAATPIEIIESCKITHGIIKNTILGIPDISELANIKKRKNEIISDVKILIGEIKKLSDNNDALTDPYILVKAVKIGILDATHLKENNFAKGKIISKIIDGACKVVDEKGKPLNEKDRLKNL
jgi:methylmalonyl-CoA mutase cobalamin-binding subunit